MKLASICITAALLAAPAALVAYSTPPAGKAGPAVVPYLCSDGHQAVAIYETGSGSRHARARLTYEGRTLEMEAAPTLYGGRYRSAAGSGEGAPLAWSLRGEEAWLTESPDADGYTREERALARCIRLRGALPADEESREHGEGHDGDHGSEH